VRRSSVKRIELVALATGIAAILLAGFALFGTRGTPGVMGVHVASVSLQERGGACRVVAKDDPIVAGRGAVIIWAVENGCSTEQEVSLTGFSPSNPLERVPPPRRVPPGQTRHIAERVRGNAADGTYHYALALNGAVQQDPDIIIEY
jgi:hypothetical protein